MEAVSVRSYAAILSVDWCGLCGNLVGETYQQNAPVVSMLTPSLKLCLALSIFQDIFGGL